MGIIAMTAILFSFNAYAECTPTPDCASIGYTATSCEGGFVRCPFDTSKLFCVPCDSSFKYDCSGDNITGGVGSVCGGKYVSCECVAGATFSNNSCVCDTSCKVGAIYYSDKTCSSCFNNTKTPIGIVVKDNELIMSNRTGSIQWGGYGTNISTLSDLTQAQAKEDINGKDNTVKIVAHFGEDVDTTKHAGVFCYKYSTEGTSAGDWYLPAAGELYKYVYNNRNILSDTWVDKLVWGNDFSYGFWSSSEISNTGGWGVGSISGDMYGYGDKNATGSVSCFLAIN